MKPKTTTATPVYSRPQRDLIWALALRFFPGLKQVGRDEVVSNDLLTQGLRYLEQKLLGEGSDLERFHRAMAGARRYELDEVDIRLPCYNRAQRDVIHARAVRVFPALARLERDELVASDLMAQTLRVLIELTLLAEARHDVRLGIPMALAEERYLAFEADMYDAALANIPLTEAA